MSSSQTLHPREEAERLRKDPLLYFRHLATYCGFTIPTYQESFLKRLFKDDTNLMQRYFRGEPLDTLFPPPQPKPERQVEDLVLEPRKGWTLAALFTEYVATKHTLPDPDHPEASELFDASHMHYRVIGNGHSYHDIVDFRWRLENLALLPGSPAITLVYDDPEPLSDDRLTSDVMRVLRTIDTGTKYISEDGGALLSTSCIVDVIKQLHLRAFPAQPSTDTESPQ